MPTRRGWAAVAAGLALWAAARFVGSDDLHMVAAGLTVLPFLAMAFVQWNRVRLEVGRHLSSGRVFAGARVTVRLSLTNRGPATTPFLLLEDRVPSTLGRPARLVVAGIPPRQTQTVTYTVRTRQRGRYTLGPLTASVTDPFGLARVRTEFAPATDLVVYPAVEELDPWGLGWRGAGAGESTVRHLHRSADEFYTMREYVTGDDLRRIHWPSVARTGRLMIRQDESTRRSVATLFVDNRPAALGTEGSPGFERAVSAAASIGRVLVRSGFVLHLATADAPSTPVGEGPLLEALAGLSAARAASLTHALARLAGEARTDTSLVLVTAPPARPEASAMARVGHRFGRKLAVLALPVDPAEVGPGPRAELEARVAAAQAALQGAGWRVLVLSPGGRLSEAWRSNALQARPPQAAWSS